ncbi:Lrp/AsnC family transcriptional regulator [Vogesella sp. LIG4]|uniref:Lrp/AsnC family transcriptional regulator n=1 Tax=Vogesella sp. LIG4 TaxID=1192162 RepID=UPI00081FFAAC|nr:Lrp/AsnC family transcriptional regulator [Vogesella sp. LIG4]SCK24738.1 DNA-binding transcriptional regulator, Lrp family [Vogesella sp. LIG4]
MSDNKLKNELDAADRTILRLLQQDGTLSNPRLAEQLSLSVTPCWRRLKRLEEEGYIKDYQANLDRRKLGLDVLAFVQIRFGVHGSNEPNEFEAAMCAQPQVLSCHKITGDADYLLQVVATSLDAYSEFVENVLRQMPGVASIHSSLALREVKAGSRLPV